MNIKLPIYLDYAATTPVDERVAEKMCDCLTRYGTFGNSSSVNHKFGWDAKKLIEEAREQVAALINAQPSEIVWTSGATEANNLAIKGVANCVAALGKKHLITSKIEHKSVLETCKFLQTQGFEVTFLSPESNGAIDINKLKAAIRPDTALISLMYVNNEIGVINDLAEIANLAHENGVIFHSDAVQGAGKLPLDVTKMPIDLMSFSAHKEYGPKGVGALFMRNKKIKLQPLIHGGKHEHGVRSGTLATHQIVGMGEAFAIAQREMSVECDRLYKLRDRFWSQIKDIEAIRLNTDLENSAPHILNVSFEYVEGESIIMALKDVAISTGSACASATLEPSYVIRALGLPDEIAHAALRFSFGRYTNPDELDYTAQLVRAKVAQLREMSPLWDMYKKGVDMNKVSWEKE